MLTDAQFYMRVLETLIVSSHPCYDGLAEEDDLREYLEKRFEVKDEDTDDGASQDKAMEHIHLTLEGFIKRLGERVGIDLKCVRED